jgi:hypothetical protein
MDNATTGKRRMGAIMDPDCLECGAYTFSLHDGVGAELKSSERVGVYIETFLYFDVRCPDCEQRQALVIHPVKESIVTLRPCTWKERACGEEECEYCTVEDA